MDCVLTYMGNKREARGLLEWALSEATNALGRSPLSAGDGFFGSGAAAQHLMELAPNAQWYLNDISPASAAVAKSRLAAATPAVVKEGKVVAERLNSDADARDGRALPRAHRYISEHWAPSTQNPKAGERVYFTCQNGRRLDVLRDGIEQRGGAVRDLLLGPLLVQASKHNNTCGNFGAYYKDTAGIGAVGGSKSQDLGRITRPIVLTLPTPFPLAKSASSPVLTQLDALAWARTLPPLDFVYLDPPYNKHPYSIYYFLLDIIAKWDKPAVPDSYRGQPKGWARSDYNSVVRAEGALDALVGALPVKVIALSYHDAGIVTEERMRKMLEKHGKVKSITASHTPYRCMQGQAGYKRVGDAVPRKEQMWVVINHSKM